MLSFMTFLFVFCPSRLFEVILLYVVSLTQFFLSSIRLILLQVGASDELAPPSNQTKFAIFTIGVGAAPVVHVRERNRKSKRRGEERRREEEKTNRKKSKAAKLNQSVADWLSITSPSLCFTTILVFLLLSRMATSRINTTLA